VLDVVYCKISDDFIDKYIGDPNFGQFTKGTYYKFSQHQEVKDAYQVTDNNGDTIFWNGRLEYTYDAITEGKFLELVLAEINSESW
jgi:hypothetical protein